MKLLKQINKNHKIKQKLKMLGHKQFTRINILKPFFTNKNKLNLVTVKIHKIEKRR